MEKFELYDNERVYATYNTRREANAYKKVLEIFTGNSGNLRVIKIKG